MMQFSHQHPWLRPVLFLGVNALVVALITFGLVLPVRDLLADRDAQIVHQRETLVRWKAIAAQHTTVTELASQIGGDEGEFLSGKNEGVIQAELQARLKAMVEKAGARLRSVRGVQPQMDGPIRYIGARLELQGTLPSIYRAVQAVETAKPYLFVSNAMMRPAPSAGPAGTSHEPTLNVQLEIIGATRAEGTER